MRIAPSLAVAVLLGGIPSIGSGQTILNTERFQLQEVTGPHLSADVALSLKRGNAEVLDLSSSGMLGTLVGRHWPRLIFGGRYLSDEEDSILDDQFVQLRYSYVLSPDTRTFHFVQIQKNQTLLLRSRWLFGGGIRKTVFETSRVSVSLGTGLMGEWERLDTDRLGADDSSHGNAVRAANLAVLSWSAPTGARILNILYVQPDLQKLGDLRILNDLGVSLPLSEVLSATISLEWRRDTRPPTALSRDDVTLTAGFALEIG